MSKIYLSDGKTEIKSTDFYTYEFSSMSEEDLNRISRKCIHLIRTTTGNELETAKAMLRVISDEKLFRANKIANDISVRNLETTKLNNQESSSRQDAAGKTNDVIKRATIWVAVASVLSALAMIVQIGVVSFAKPPQAQVQVVEVEGKVKK
jgi:hypothetical protein